MADVWSGDSDLRYQILESSSILVVPDKSSQRKSFLNSLFISYLLYFKWPVIGLDCDCVLTDRSNCDQADTLTSCRFSASRDTSKVARQTA